MKRANSLTLKQCPFCCCFANVDCSFRYGCRKKSFKFICCILPLPLPPPTRGGGIAFPGRWRSNIFYSPLVGADLRTDGVNMTRPDSENIERTWTEGSIAKLFEREANPRQSRNLWFRGGVFYSRSSGIAFGVKLYNLVSLRGRLVRSNPAFYKL